MENGTNEFQRIDIDRNFQATRSYCHLKLTHCSSRLKEFVRVFKLILKSVIVLLEKHHPEPCHLEVERSVPLCHTFFLALCPSTAEWKYIGHREI